MTVPPVTTIVVRAGEKERNLQNEIVQRNHMIHRLGQALDEANEGTARARGISHMQVQHLAEKVNVANAHVDECERQMRRAGYQCHDLTVELLRARELACAIFGRKNAIQTALEEAHVEHRASLANSASKYEEIIKRQQREMQEITNRCNELNSELGVRNAQVRNCEERISQAERQINTKDEQTKQQEQRILSLSNELDSMRDQLNTQLPEALKLRNTIRERDSELDVLKQNLSQKASEEGTNHKTLTDLADKYRFERDKYKVELEEAASAALAAERETERAKKKYESELAEYTARGKAEIEAMKSTISTHQSEIESLRTQLRNSASGTSTADRVEMEGLKIRLAQMETDVVAHNEASARHESENHRIVAECRTLVDEVKLKAETDLKTAVAPLMKRIEELEVENEKLDISNADLMRQMNQMAYDSKNTPSTPIRKVTVNDPGSGSKVPPPKSDIELELEKIRVEAGLPASSSQGPSGTPPGPPNPPGGGDGSGNPGGGGGGRPANSNGKPAVPKSASPSDRKKTRGGGGGGPPGGDDGFDDEEDGWEEPEEEDEDGANAIGLGGSQTLKVVVQNSTKKKEAEKVTVPKFPTLASLNGWTIQLAQNLVQAGGRNDCEEVDWLNKVIEPGSSIDSLADSGQTKFKSLDLKLAAALSAVVRDGGPENLIDDLAEMNREAMSKGSMMKGRQIVWMIYNHFKTNPNLAPVYSIVDLTALKWMGDNNIHTFRHMWNFITRNMVEKLRDNSLADLLYSQMKNSKVLQVDLAHYRRHPDGHPDHSYRFLRDCMDRQLERVNTEKNRDDYSSLLKAMAKGAGAAPAPGDPKAKGKAKAKAKGKAKAKAKAGADAKDKKAPCWFHHVGGSCTFSAQECRYSHAKISEEEKKKIPRPRSQSRERPNKVKPGAPGTENSGSGDKDKKAAAAGQGLSFMPCKDFLTPGGCKYGKDCIFAHIDDEAVRACKAAAEARKKRDKSKTRNKEQS